VWLKPPFIVFNARMSISVFIERQIIGVFRGRFKARNGLTFGDVNPP
jgi:hypothetical protein